MRVPGFPADYPDRLREVRNRAMWSGFSSFTLIQDENWMVKVPQIHLNNPSVLNGRAQDGF